MRPADLSNSDRGSGGQRLQNMQPASIGISSMFVLVLSIAIAVWSYQVNSEVDAPYMDEIFHIRQALVYWRNEWSVWDPKITTPPGLYVLSYGYLYAAKLLSLVLNSDGTAALADATTALVVLRSMNALLLLAVFFLVYRVGVASRCPGPSACTCQREVSVLSHLKQDPAGFAVAAIVCLFPPLFFFSALFYTDILSVLLVLLADDSHNKGAQVLTAVTGLLSLGVRQTNVFWTGLYLAGLEFIKGANSAPSPRALRGRKYPELMRWSWDTESIYQIEIKDAEPEVLYGLKDCRRISQRLLPYAVILTSFAVFIFANGGVVLGDKSNHVASINLPQMLYIWPFMVFFSWPTLLPKLVHNVARLRAVDGRSRRSPSSAISQLLQPSALMLMVSAVILALLVVHYNTIVHPFTLADNRHYNFYVFRILRRHYLIKYLAVPVYLFCGWACISALGRLSRPNSLKAPAPTGSKEPKQDSREFEEEAVQVSWLVVWLTVCSLSLATAPLVEPRYLILPWMAWRLRVPLPPAQLSLRELLNPEETKHVERSRNAHGLRARLGELSVRWTVLSLELVWVLLINGVTGYMFLKQGFEWRHSEEEAGNVQRFMW